MSISTAGQSTFGRIMKDSFRAALRESRRGPRPFFHCSDCDENTTHTYQVEEIGDRHTEPMVGGWCCDECQEGFIADSEWHEEN